MENQLDFNYTEQVKNIDSIKLDNLSIEEIKKLGFPYLRYPEEMLLSEFINLKNKDINTILDNNFIKTSKSYTKLASQFFPHMFNTRVVGMKTPIEAWNSDKLLQRAVDICRKYSKNPTISTLRSKLMIVSGTQCVSNFRPDVAKLIYNKFGNNGKIFDFSMGYGGRLVGFLASNCQEYVGVDVNTLNFDGYNSINSLYNKENKITRFVKCPAEDFCEYTDYFDLAFSSPPYFCKEQYSKDENQSCNKYKQYDSWRDNFLCKVIFNNYKMLKPNRYFVINIADINLGSKKYPLVNDTIELSIKNEFELDSTLEYSLKKTIGTRASFTDKVCDYKKEPVLIFKKNIDKNNIN